MSRRRNASDPEPERPERELLDPRHNRASIHDADADHFVLAPGKVFDNFREALARIDLDPTGPVSIADVASVDEMIALFRLGLGAALIAEIVNQALTLMIRRYPEKRVRHEIDDAFDLRTRCACAVSDEDHQLGLDIFNARTRRADDLTPEIVAEMTDGLSPERLLAVVIVVFLLYGYKNHALHWARSAGV